MSPDRSLELTRELSGGEPVDVDTALSATAPGAGRSAGSFAETSPAGWAEGVEGVVEGCVVTGAVAGIAAELSALFSALRSASAARMTSVLTGVTLADGVSVAASIVALDAAGGGGCDAQAASNGPIDNRVRYFMFASL